MSIALLAFYAFAAITVGSAVLVTLSRNPVHSVLWLILAFLSAAGLMVLMGAEFVAMLLIIVYVGAVAVLFLFVVMMLDVDFEALKGEMARMAPLGLVIGVVMLFELALGLGTWVTSDKAASLRQGVTPDPTKIDNTRALGMLLYTKYLYLFETAGLILLVAMIGAIVLTIRHRKDVKRQDVLAQMWRDPAKAMELKNVKPGQGL